MDRCLNEVVIYIEHGWDFRKVVRRCGETDPRDGSRLQCDDCEEKS